MAKVHSGGEMLPKGSTVRVGYTNVTGRHSTDRRQTTDRQTDGFAIAKIRT